MCHKKLSYLLSSTHIQAGMQSWDFLRPNFSDLLDAVVRKDLRSHLVYLQLLMKDSPLRTRTIRPHLILVPQHLEHHLTSSRSSVSVDWMTYCLIDCISLSDQDDFLNQNACQAPLNSLVYRLLTFGFLCLSFHDLILAIILLNQFKQNRPPPPPVSDHPPYLVQCLILHHSPGISDNPSARILLDGFSQNPLWPLMLLLSNFSSTDSLPAPWL